MVALPRVTEQINLFEEVVIDRNRLIVKISKRLHPKYVIAPFFVEYPESVALHEVPQTTLLIPALFNIAPVVWLSGLTFTVDEIDEAALHALNNVRQVFEKMYPTVNWRGSVIAQHHQQVSNGSTLAKPPGQAEDNSRGLWSQLTESAVHKIVLFSGGLDSVCTSIRHRDSRQILMSVWGADIRLDEDKKWSTVHTSIADYAKQFGHDVAFVKSNLREFLNADYLDNANAPISNWWGLAQHGLGLTGLAAPLAALHRIQEVLIASSHTVDFDAPWGSHPTIDNKIAWTGTRVHHDAFELSRQQKLALCVDDNNRHAIAPLQLRVCYSAASQAGENCGVCEKCLRTAAGLVVLGEEPSHWGMPVAANEAVERIITAFSIRRFELGDNGVFMWQDIQRDAKRRVEPCITDSNLLQARTKLVNWFANVDFRVMTQEHPPRGGVTRRLKRFLKVHFPGSVAVARRMRKRLGATH